MYSTVTSLGTAIYDNFNVGFSKTISGSARFKAHSPKTVSGAATFRAAGGLALGGLAFPGGTSKPIVGPAHFAAHPTRSIHGSATFKITPALLDPSIRPDVSEDAEDLYSPYNRQDADYGWALLRFCDAICTGIQWTDDLVRTTDEGPGWSGTVDLDRTPDDALPWLAQFIGVDTIPSLDPASQRLRIRETTGFQRGTVAAIAGTARQYLTGNKTVIVNERTESPYRLSVTTFLTETPDPDAVNAALQAQKPAGLLLTLIVSSGATYGALTATGMTYGDLEAAYATYATMKLTILV